VADGADHHRTARIAAYPDFDGGVLDHGGLRSPALSPPVRCARKTPISCRIMLKKNRAKALTGWNRKRFAGLVPRNVQYPIGNLLFLGPEVLYCSAAPNHRPILPSNAYPFSQHCTPENIREHRAHHTWPITIRHDVWVGDTRHDPQRRTIGKRSIIGARRRGGPGHPAISVRHRCSHRLNRIAFEAARSRGPDRDPPGVGLARGNDHRTYGPVLHRMRQLHRQARRSAHERRHRPVQAFQGPCDGCDKDFWANISGALLVACGVATASLVRPASAETTIARPAEDHHRDLLRNGATKGLTRLSKTGQAPRSYSTWRK